MSKAALFSANSQVPEIPIAVPLLLCVADAEMNNKIKEKPTLALVQAAAAGRQRSLKPDWIYFCSTDRYTGMMHHFKYS